MNLDSVRGAMSRKVAGVPVLYIAGGAVAILAVYAWKTKGSTPEATATDTASSSEQASSAFTELYPDTDTGTVIVAPSTAPVTETATGYDSNDEWIKDGMGTLAKTGISPGAAQVALQSYLAGSQLSYTEGQMRDTVIREIGAPPYLQESGGTAPESSTPAVAPENSTALRLSVTNWYQQYLGRAPAATEVDSWVNTGADSGTVESGIRDSGEGRNRRISAAYQTYLGRSPSQSELAAWDRTGSNEAAIIAAIRDSTEAKARR